MKTLWIISELYYPEENATGYVLTQIAEGLAPDYHVRVLCAQPTYAQRGLRAPRTEDRRGVGIRRCWSTTFSPHRLPLRVVNAITIGASLFCAALRRVQRDDAVLVVTNPPTLPVLIGLVCKWRRAHGILLVHDVYPEVLIAAGLATNQSLVVRALRWVTAQTLKAYERIVVLGRDMHQLFARRKGVPERCLVTIPNAGEPDRIQPQGRRSNPLLSRLGLLDRFVLLYAGNMGRTHGLEVWIRAALALRAEEVHFLFIGSGSRKEWLRQTVTEQRLENLTVAPYPAREEQTAMLNACDVAIISLMPGMTGISVPSRLYNVLAAGKPIIAVTDLDSELAQVVQEEGIGWVVGWHETDKLIEVIRQAKAAPAQLLEMGKRARRAAESKYNVCSMLGRYRELVADLGMKPAGPTVRRTQGGVKPVGDGGFDHD